MVKKKNLLASAGDTSSIPGSGRSFGGGNSNPLQYSSLENPMDRGVRQATVHGVTESDSTGQLSMNTQSYTSHRRFSKTLWIYIFKPDLSHELFAHVANCPRNLPPKVLEPQTVDSGGVFWSVSSSSYEMNKLGRLPSRVASASLSQTGLQTLSLFS